MKKPKWCCDCGLDFDAERAQCERCHYCTGCCICQTEGKVTVDQEDQRDHAEESANRAAMEREAREELAAERTIAAWRHADAHAQVALINACDWYVRARHLTAAVGVEIALAIMVSALHGVGAHEATVIVTEEIYAADQRKGC